MNNDLVRLCDQLGTSGLWLNARPDDAEDWAAAFDLSQQPPRNLRSYGAVTQDVADSTQPLALLDTIRNDAPRSESS